VYANARQSNKTGSIYVEPTNVKQIAGRAGRLSSNYKVGLVTTWQEADLAYVRAVLNFDVPELDFAGTFFLLSPLFALSILSCTLPLMLLFLTHPAQNRNLSFSGADRVFHR
jgi:hypothetical protein